MSTLLHTAFYTPCLHDVTLDRSASTTSASSGRPTPRSLRSSRHRRVAAAATPLCACCRSGAACASASVDESLSHCSSRFTKASQRRSAVPPRSPDTTAVLAVGNMSRRTRSCPWRQYPDRYHEPRRTRGDVGSTRWRPRAPTSPYPVTGGLRLSVTPMRDTDTDTQCPAEPTPGRVLGGWNVESGHA